jgi:hypothetical protein
MINKAKLALIVAVAAHRLRSLDRSTAIYVKNKYDFCSSKFEFSFLNGNLMVPANPLLICRRCPLPGSRWEPRKAELRGRREPEKEQIS